VTRSRIAAPVLLGALAVASLGHSAFAQSPRIRDSVGIRIVESSSRLNDLS